MPPCVGFVSPLPAKGLGHKCICTWPGHAEHLRYPLRPVSFESSLACSEGLPSSQLFAPPAVTPPSPILGAGQHKDTGCSRRVFPFLPPASRILRTGWPQAHFSKFQLPSSKQQLSSPLSFILPPADSPVPKPRCLESHTSHSPPRSTHSFRLPQAPTASVFPPEMPPLVPQHHRVHPVQPQTRTRHQPGPFCAEGSTECWRELSRSFWERRQPGKTTGGLGAGQDMPLHQLCPGSGSWINTTREPSQQKAVLLFPPANNCPRHARGAPAERRLRGQGCAFMSSFISVALVP